MKMIQLKKTNKFLFAAIIGTVIGVLFKIVKYKIPGDVFLGFSTFIWVFFIYTLITSNKKTKH